MFVYFVVYLTVVYISVCVRYIVYDGWCLSLMEPLSTAQHRNIPIIYNALMLPLSIVNSTRKTLGKTMLFVLNRMQIRFSTHLSELERNLGQNNKTEPNTCDGKYYVSRGGCKILTSV